jgi:hypothetical protein
MKKVKIYCLYNPEDCKIRYIGRTTKLNLKHRLIEHITKSKYFEVYYPNLKLPHKANWINSLLKKGIEPKIKLLTIVDGWEESHVFEQKLINKYKNKYNLTNSQDRGDGGLNNNLTKETRKKISENLKQGYSSGRIVKPNKKVYFFNNNGEFLFKKESLAEASIFLDVGFKVLSKRIINNSSYKNYFLSYKDKLKIENYKYCYDLATKKYFIFLTIKEIRSFLKISRFFYEKHTKEKTEYNGFGINCTNPKKPILFELIKENTIYPFMSYKEASNFIGCDLSSIYKIIYNNKKSIKKFKLSKNYGK